MLRRCENMVITRNRRAFRESGLCVGIGLFFLSIALNIPFLLYGINMLDEGLLVYGTERVMEGSVLYKDIFTLYAPGHYYILGGFMKILGLNLFSERLYSCIIGGALAFLVFYISKRIIKNITFSIVASLIFIFLVQLQNDRMFFALLALLCLIEYDYNHPKLNSIWWPLIIGLLTGMSIIMSQEVGIYLVLALCSFLPWKLFVGKKRNMKQIVNLKSVAHQAILFLFGLLIIVIPVVFYFYKYGALHEMFYCLFWYPIHAFPETMSLPFPNLFSNLLLTLNSPSLRSFYSLAGCILFYLPIVIYTITAIFLVSRLYSNQDYSKRDSYVFLILVFGILSFKTATVRSDISHLMFCIIPAVILGCFLLDKLYVRLSNNLTPFVGSKSKKLVAFKCSVVIIFLILIFYGQIGHLLLIIKNSNYEKLGLDRAQNILVPKNEKEDIANVVKYIKDNTDSSDKIFVIPYQAMFYFLSDRDTPTKYDIFLPGYVNQRGDQIQLVQQLERAKPKFTIYGHGWDVDGKPFETYAPIIHNYIKQQWYIEKKYGIYEIYSHK